MFSLNLKNSLGYARQLYLSKYEVSLREVAFTRVTGFTSGNAVLEVWALRLR